MKKVLILIFLTSVNYFYHEELNAQAIDFAAIPGLDNVLKDTENPVLPESEDLGEDDQEIMQNRMRAIDDQKAKEYSFQRNADFYPTQRQKFSDNDLTYFGYDFFTNLPISFNQADKYGLNEDYILGEGDNIKIMFFGGRNDAFTSKINRQGEIVIPELGPIKLAGVKFSDAKTIIESEVSQKYIGTSVVISLGDLRSINIFVLGEVTTPGMYQVSSLSTLTNAIFASGGVRTSGSLRNIQLKRNGSVVGVLDFYKLLLNGDTSQDLRVLPGDVVFIPSRSNSVAIEGEIYRPGVYELVENEVLSDLVAYAGNLKATANKRSFDIHRIEGQQDSISLIQEIPNDVSITTTELKNGDLVIFYPVNNVVKKAIKKSGHTSQPGLHPWRKNMRVGDVISNKFELLPNTDLAYLLIRRQGTFPQEYEYYQVNLANIFSDKDSKENIQLNEGDEMIFFPRLLEPRNITTKLIQDNYVFDEFNNLIINEERSDLQYFRRSLIDQLDNSSMDSQKNINQQEVVKGQNPYESRYYEYSIYDYCTISKNLAMDVLDSMGYQEKKSIPLEDLENLSQPEDIQLLVTQIEKDKAERENEKQSTDDSDISDRITKDCRNQLLEPHLAFLDKQQLPGNKKKIIDVFGNVHFPGKYPLSNNMSLRGAIEAAGGLKETSLKSEIEITSSNIRNRQITTVNKYAGLNNNSETQKLSPLDIINIKQIFKQTKTITITGEVFFPGIYPISDGETLSQVLERAGGIKPKGSVEAANFRREELAELQIEKMEKAKNDLKRKILFSAETFGSNDSAAMSMTTDVESIGRLIESTGNTNPEFMGRLVIDLQGILDKSKEDIVLEDLDRIHIPKKKQTVTVVGEVYVENSHIYENQFDLADYINFSGGGTSFADVDNIYLVKADGRIVLPNSGGFFRGRDLIAPGDTIVVPMDTQPFDTLKATTEITQIIYQMGLAAAAINSL